MTSLFSSLSTTLLQIQLVLSIICVNQYHINGQGVPFNPANLTILSAAASSSNTTVSVIEIDKTTVNQSAVQTISIPGTGTNAIRVSGSATSTLYGSNSNDGSLFCFTGHNNTNTASNANTLNPRAVMIVDHLGNVNLATTYTGTSGQQTRCATTINNSNFYISDQAGQYTNNASGASPTANIRGIKSFGGVVYVGQASSSATIIQVSTSSAISGGSLTGLPGISNNASHQDFYLISSGSNGTSFDVLYIVSATSNTVGTISKFSLVSGTWVANGSFTTTFGGFGLIAEKEGTGASLYVSTGQGALATNAVRKLTDAAGYNTTINITANIVLFNAATGSIIKGIAFAPKAPPAPSGPAVNLSLNTTTASEANNTVITITATAASAVSGNQNVAVNITGTNINGEDYFLSSGVITILNGGTIGSVSLTILDDAVLESNETMTITLSNPSSGLTLGTTISQNVSIEENNCSFLRRVSSFTSLNGAEIPAFDPSSNRVYVVAGTLVEAYSLNNVGVLSSIGPVALGFTPPVNTNALPNSVAVKNGILAVAYAIQNTTSLAQEIGKVALYQASDASFIHVVDVGYLPDMLTFSLDGNKILTANEGEPNSYGQGNSFDPEGSISIIDISNGVLNATVQNASFTSFNGQETTLRDAGIRIYGPGASAAQDFEPEYISFTADGTKAYITLQENNALAVLNLSTATITQILPLGKKNHNMTGNEMDASDQDQAINIQNWPVLGLYQPDAIASYAVGGQTYFVTANEGDSRNYTGFNEEVRVGAVAYVLDPTVFPNAATLKQNSQLGRLQVTNASGDTDLDGDFDQIEVYGSRSFSIWNESGTLIYDSGNQLEQITSVKTPATFNSDGTAASFDSRSDNKGPEPEGVVIGYIDNKPFAFIGLERSGDVIVYDISNPPSPNLVQYINNPLDLAVEGLTFVDAENSPTKKPLLITASEGSKTITIYEVGTGIVTNTSNTGAGSLRNVIACVVEGGTVTYDQPTTSTTLLTGTLPIDKNLTILGTNINAKPEITVDFGTLGVSSGISVNNGKTVILNNVDFKEINNTNLPKNAIFQVDNNAILKVTGSTTINN